MVELEGQYKRLKYNAKTFIAFKRGSGILDGRWQMFETYTQVELSIVLIQARNTKNLESANACVKQQQKGMYERNSVDRTN